MKRATRPDLNTEIITAIEDLRQREGNEYLLSVEIQAHLEVFYPDSKAKDDIVYIHDFLSDMDDLRRKPR